MKQRPFLLLLAAPATLLALRQIAGGPAGNIPISNGTNLVSRAMSGDASITSTGVVTVSKANGNAFPAAFAVGDLPYASAPSTLSRLPIGSASQVLTVSSGLPAWANITTVPAAGGVSGLSN